jgi:hypothetical protein
LKKLLIDIALGLLIFAAIVTVVLFAVSKAGNFIYGAF